MGRILLGWLWVAAIVSAMTGEARAADHPVSFPADAFPAAYSPSSVEAGAGDTVTFSGAFASHPLVWNDGDFATRSAGTTNTYTLTRPGTFRFHCQLHGTMTGVVHVPGNVTAAPDFAWTVSGAKASFTASGSDPDGTIARFEWDLDGNGTFETTGATATRTYAARSTTTVQVRSVDDAHETSPATAHAVTVGGTPSTPPPGGGAGGGGTTPPPSGPSGGVGGGDGGTGGGGSTIPATTSPTGGGQGADDAGSPGVRVISASLAFRHGRARVTIALPRSGAVRVRLARAGTTLAAGTTSQLAAGRRRLTVRLTRAGTRALRAGKRVRATLTVTLRPRAGGASLTARRSVTLR
jgi:plastocyanin